MSVSIVVKGQGFLKKDVEFDISIPWDELAVRLKHYSSTQRGERRFLGWPPYWDLAIFGHTVTYKLLPAARSALTARLRATVSNGDGHCRLVGTCSCNRLSVLLPNLILALATLAWVPLFTGPAFFRFAGVVMFGLIWCADAYEVFRNAKPTVAVALGRLCCVVGILVLPLARAATHPEGTSAMPAMLMMLAPYLIWRTIALALCNSSIDCAIERFLNILRATTAAQGE